MSSFGYGSTYDACAGSTTIVVYAPPGYATPMVGMIFYDNSNLTSPHNGGSSGQWFLLEKGGTTWAAQVFTDGEVLDYVDCSTLVTPTGTPASTPPVTPSQTPTSASLGAIYISNSSLDISITDVEINGVSVTYDGGQNFPVDTSDNGFFTTTQLGTYNIVVYYGASISGQHIDVTDSNSTLTCHNVPGNGSGTFTVTSAIINSVITVNIDVLDGTC
jgi:hypothetical protein